MLHWKRNMFYLPQCKLRTSHNRCTTSLSGVGWLEAGGWKSVVCIEASTVWCRVGKACVEWMCFAINLHPSPAFSLRFLFHLPPFTLTSSERLKYSLFYKISIRKFKWLSKNTLCSPYEFCVQPQKKTRLFLTECGGRMIRFLFRTCHA